MKKSAGILAYRLTTALQVFLVHPGGPFFKNKDAGAWTIPKGEIENGEEELVAAQREFLEETGIKLEGEFLPLGEIRQKAGKIVTVWAVQQNIDEKKIISNTFQLVWPPKSGTLVDFPEIDKAGWFSIEEAKIKINQAQVELLVRLVEILKLIFL